MKKRQGIDIVLVLAYTFIILIVIYLGIQFFTGYSPNYVSTLFLYAAAGWFLPLILTVVLAGWGTWLYVTRLAF